MGGSATTDQFPVNRSSRWLLAARLLARVLPWLILGLCCAWPLIWLVDGIVRHGSVWRDLHLTDFRVALLGRTLLYNGTVAILAMAMGLPAGLALGRSRGWTGRILWLVVPAALFMPSMAFAYGWSQLVRITQPAYHPLGFGFIPGGFMDISRCIWTLAAWLWAVPACMVGLALRRMDTALQQHALLDGALMRITLRSILGPLLAGGAAVMILATQEFAVYEPTGISVVATEVRMVFDSGVFSSLSNPMDAGMTGMGSGAQVHDQQHRAAAAVVTAVPLLVITLILAGLGAWCASSLAEGQTLEQGHWPRCLDAPRWALWVTLLLLLINVAMPIAGLVFSMRLGFSPVRIWNEFADKVGGSLIVGAAVAGVAMVLALCAAMRWPRGGLLLAGLSFLIGGQLLAIAMIRLCNRPTWGLDLWAYDGMPLPILTYVGRFGWIAMAGAHSCWSRSWKDLRLMAASDGAGPFQAAWSVVWPLAWPSLLAGAILVGALSLTEVPATVIISPQHPQVLTPQLMTWVHMQRFDPMIEASLLMIALVLVPAIFVIALAALGSRRQRRWTAQRG